MVESPDHPFQFSLLISPVFGVLLLFFLVNARESPIISFNGVFPECSITFVEFTEA